MPNIFKRFLVFLVLASLGLQSLVIYLPHVINDVTKIWTFELSEETDNSEIKKEKSKNEKEKVEYDWFHSSNSFQFVLNCALRIHKRFFCNYLSHTPSLLNPPPEMLS